MTNTRDLVILERDVDDRRGTEGGEADHHGVSTEARRAAGYYVSLASLGGRPGEHLQALVAAAMQWLDADDLEHQARIAPIREHESARADVACAMDALLVVARNVAMEARRSAVRALGQSAERRCVPIALCSDKGCLASCDLAIIDGTAWEKYDSGWLCPDHRPF